MRSVRHGSHHALITTPHGWPRRLAWSAPILRQTIERRTAMPTVDLVVPGFTIRSDQSRLGLSTETLVRGQRNTIVDAGHNGRPGKIQEGLEDPSEAPPPVHSLVFPHPHSDHTQNL